MSKTYLKLQLNYLTMKSKYTLVGKSLLLSFALLSPTHNALAHSGSSTSAAWKACDNKVKSESCEYKGFHGDRYIGTCQYMSAYMMCVRNQPIIKAKPKIEKIEKEDKVTPEVPEKST